MSGDCFVMSGDDQFFQVTVSFMISVTIVPWSWKRAISNFSGAQTCHEWWQICHEWWHAGWALFPWCLTALFALNELPTALLLQEDINTTLKSVGSNQWSWANTLRAKSWAINLEINFQPPRHSSLIRVSSFYFKSVLEFGLLGI